MRSLSEGDGIHSGAGSLPGSLRVMPCTHHLCDVAFQNIQLLLPLVTVSVPSPLNRPVGQTAARQVFGASLILLRTGSCSAVLPIPLPLPRLQLLRLPHLHRSVKHQWQQQQENDRDPGSDGPKDEIARIKKNTEKTITK